MGQTYTNEKYKTSEYSLNKIIRQITVNSGCVFWLECGIYLSLIDKKYFHSLLREQSTC